MPNIGSCLIKSPVCKLSSHVKDGKRSILFSTHITSDLDKCADDITYIKNGEIIASADKASFIQAFQSLKAPGEDSLNLEEIMVRNERGTYNV